VLPRISRAILQATGAQAFNLLQNNGATAHQAVMHVHFHIIPKYADGSGLGIGWPTRTLNAEEGKQQPQPLQNGYARLTDRRAAANVQRRQILLCP
jgi:diadenosine tetraphosphate (Ap4A) HIT family hydrolase